MDAHPHPNFGMKFEVLANLKRAPDGRFRATAKYERATIARG